MMYLIYGTQVLTEETVNFRFAYGAINKAKLNNKNKMESLKKLSLNQKEIR